MHLIATRYTGLSGGRFHRRSEWDGDLREGELATALKRAKAGDEDAVRYLYLRFSANVYGYARSLLRDEHEAEDVAQQVFARLMVAIEGYEDRGVPFSSWLLRVTHNLAIDHMRRRLTLLDPDVLPEDVHDERGGALARALRDALDELPEAQRRVVVLRHIAGLTPGEIAAELGRTEDAVHGLHHRGRRAVRARLRTLDAVPMVAVA